MPNGQPAQLANLRPYTSENGPKGPSARHSGHVDRAIRFIRKCTPETAEFVVSVMRDPEQPIMARLRAAELILNRTIPTKDGAAMITLAGERVTSIELNIVSSEANMLEQSVFEHGPPRTITITAGDGE